MATLRTWEEKSAILAHCIELEKEGGDILAYLWSENYLTPRATWFNFQREWLGRKPYEYTDGKPRKVKEKRKVVHEKKKLTTEQMVVVDTALAGGNPIAVLKEQGSKNASAAWFYIKKKLQEEDPEKYEQLTKERLDKGMPKKIGPDGKEYEKLELEAGGNYQLSVAPEQTTETRISQDAVGLKIDQTKSPVFFGEFEVTAVRHPEFGEFYFDQKFNRIDWRNPEGDEVSFAPGSWKRLTEALPQIMGILGVKV